MISEQSKPQIAVKQAVRAAMDYVRDLYADEKIYNLGLEEVTLDDGIWLVTLGFSRPWNVPRVRRSMYDVVPGTTTTDPFPERNYKVVKIDAETGTVLGMEIREE